MSRITGIGWTHATWSPWWGCVECSPACDNCYARDLAHRFGFDVWGRDKPRRFFGEKHWAEPLKWNREAGRKGIRLRVFPSMCDPFERYSGPDAAKMLRARGEFLELVEFTPHLDWLLTTKRPQEIRRMIPPAWLQTPRHNVWYIVTIESPEYYWRWHEVAKVPGVVRGISYEPALKPIRIRDMVHSMRLDDVLALPVDREFPDWMILGGESGHKARLFNLDTMAVPLIAECRQLGVSVFFKQTGDHYSMEGSDQLVNITGKGDKPEEWPEMLRVQEYPEVRHA
jgi:protein gp37